MDKILSENKFNKGKYILKFIDKGILRMVEKDDYSKEQKKGVVTFSDTDLDKSLLTNRADKILKKLKLPLPSNIKNEKLEVIKNYQKKAETYLNYFGKLLSKKAELYTEKGINKADPKSKEPRAETKRQIKYYNVLGIYVNNISKLENYAEKTGQGIIHFNNPLQLLNRLELLIVSLLAGNNGVIQEFSQISHLLHQMKVITKKQLNDLLKKYVLNK